MLTLPKEHRKLFREPFGELHQSIEEIIPIISKGTVYAVGGLTFLTLRLMKMALKSASQLNCIPARI